MHHATRAEGGGGPDRLDAGSLPRTSYFWEAAHLGAGTLRVGAWMDCLPPNAIVVSVTRGRFSTIPRSRSDPNANKRMAWVRVVPRQELGALPAWGSAADPHWTMTPAT